MPDGSNVKPDNPDWPRWTDKATRGDLIKIAIRQQAINTRLATVLLHFINGDVQDARHEWNSYFVENKKLADLIDQLGSGEDD